MGVRLKPFETAGSLWSKSNGANNDDILRHDEPPFFCFLYSHSLYVTYGVVFNVFVSNSNYGFHLAGSRGLFLKAAKTCFILLNGSVALKFVIGQPQRRVSVATDTFSASSEPVFKATGALDKQWKNLSCDL
jgi:hypothetical protein